MFALCKFLGRGDRFVLQSLLVIALLSHPADPPNDHSKLIFDSFVGTGPNSASRVPHAEPLALRYASPRRFCSRR
jgi:hypothetical protein